MLMNDFEKYEVYHGAAKYPEHFKIVQIRVQAAMLRRFVLWMNATQKCNLPEGVDAERLIVQFFGIDLQKLELEKSKMLERCKVIKPRQKGNI